MNGTAPKEQVLVLIERVATSPAAGGFGERLRRLVVLSGVPGDGYHLAGEGRRLLICDRCGGAFFGALRAPVDLKAGQSTFSVHQVAGSNELLDQTFTFALLGGTPRLTAYVQENINRNTGQTITIRTDYLTGARVIVTDFQGAKSTTTRHVSTRPPRLAGLDGGALADIVSGAR